jgi:TRAP-type C4-dicarboxylate transport system permease small subunit
MFYNLLCPGKAALNTAFICGTNVVIRAAALDKIGGLPQDSVTEDFAASIALHPFWRSTYLTDVLATGLGPLDVPSYLKQQNRWAMGTLGVFRTHWRKIFLPTKQGLHIEQRVQYLLACTHYLCGLRDLIYLISPILFIFTGIPAVGGATLSEYLWHFLPYCLLSATAMWYSSRSITGLRGIAIGFGSFPTLIGSLLSVILRRKVGFSVTSKQRGRKRSLSYLWVYFFFLLLCVASLFWATQVKGQQQVSLLISVLWVVYSIFMLGGFLWLNYKDIRFQAAVQQSGTTDETIANRPYPSKLSQRKRGLTPVWNLGLAALIAVPILASGSLFSLAFSINGNATPFVMSQEKIVSPFFGVSLPVQLLTTRPPVLEHDLNTQFSIIGRTQDIHDSFDKSWADQLAAQHARPWITLQFGAFGPGNKPPFDANLPAIINGLHDQNLRRWAEDIRDYNKPVYLTILLHADRNWSLSSGVANGGIPQDVPKAWMHVQSVFRAAGANNVAWVWAPADPIHDQQYAPPASTIDAVLQSFIDYPGAQWGNPQTVLHNLVTHYPTKPLFIEASVNGPAAQKAAWLTKLGQAVNDCPHVYALLYHEGGPGLQLSSAQIESWSLASDPASLAAMQRVVVSLHKR